MSDARPLTVADLHSCFLGLIPAVLATASASGVPNVTYLSRAHPVDDERIALSNQFFAKSSRNLAENPRASLLLIKPESHAQFRVTMTYERTERRGPVFERLRADLQTIAALTGMEKVFHLQAADIYRVTQIEQLNEVSDDAIVEAFPAPDEAPGPAHLGELCARLSRCGDLDTLVRVTVDGLAELLGYEHNQLLLLDEAGTRLFSIASHGYPAAGVGAEVAVGEGVVGVAADRCAPVLVANSEQLAKYARSVRTSYEASGDIDGEHEIAMVGLDEPGSQLATPVMALGRLVGVLVVESRKRARYTMGDAAALAAVGGIVASSIETLRAEVRTSGAPSTGAVAAPTPADAVVHVRHYPTDGSTFLDGDYLIKGVAGKLLWSLLRQHRDERRTDFTNREVRLDPTLDLPDFRDNFESRLILLKRRLDERAAPVRITKTGRGRFRLDVDGIVRLESMEA